MVLWCVTRGGNEDHIESLRRVLAIIICDAVGIIEGRTPGIEGPGAARGLVAYLIGFGLHER